MRLSEQRTEAFTRDGYIVTEGFLSDAEISHLTDCYEQTLARLNREGALENVQSGEDRDEDFQVFQIRTAHLQHPIFDMLIHDTRLLDIVECLLGPDIRLIHYQGLHKPSKSGGEVGWHQDNHYFNVANDRTITVWLPLDDATVDNGCMWYLPGQHTHLLAHEQLWDKSQKKGFYYAIRDLDETGAVPAEVGKGGLAIHHCLMPHRSLKNETDRPRRSIAMHFMDAKMPDPEMLKILPEGAAPVLRRR
ncbi:MAG: phytanoyl-CoA dioxygenase family protein [Hyphomicrobiaceae bacterium]